jgi:hypothetical protein
MSVTLTVTMMSGIVSGSASSRQQPFAMLQHLRQGAKRHTRATVRSRREEAAGDDGLRGRAAGRRKREEGTPEILVDLRTICLRHALRTTSHRDNFLSASRQADPDNF